MKALFGTTLTVAILGGIALKIKEDLVSTKFFFYFALTHLFMSLFGVFIFGIESTIYQLVSSIAICLYLIIDI